MQSTKKLIGAINPLQSEPCFMVPIFQDKFGYYTQELDGKDTIKNFKKVALTKTIVTPISSEVGFSVSDKAIKVIDIGNGKILYGNKESVSLQLRSKINSLKHKPFLLKEIADFLCDEALLNLAESCIANLLNSEQKIVNNKFSKSKSTRLSDNYINSHRCFTRVIFNQKGGVGKSTITCNLAAISAVEGKRTLVIDLDIQGNSTQYLLGHKITDPDKTIAHFFKGCLGISIFGGDKAELSNAIHETPFPNLFVLPSHPELEALQNRFDSKYKIFKFRDAIEKLEGFDAIYIDTPPVLNFYSQSALIAAKKCLIPFDCDTFARDALYTLMNSLAEVKADYNEDLEIEGIVVNQYQKQANLPRQLVEELIAENLPVLEAKISPSVKIRESHTQSQPLVYFAPDHKLTDEYRDLFIEIQK